MMERLANVDIVVRSRPTSEELAMAGTDSGETLFGLYTGIPLTKRSSSYGMVLPDKITLYQRSIEEGCRTKSEIQAQIRTTLLHEIGHHFGLSEDELEQAGYK
jgi:predicted Zn-dependent protease with MMP-like domain